MRPTTTLRPRVDLGARWAERSRRVGSAAVAVAAHLCGAILLAGATVLAGAPRAAAQSPCCDPWTDLGQALAGTHGAPSLEATGSLAEGTLVSLSVDGALETAPAWLVVGLSELGAPFKGGTLMPAPSTVLPVATDAAGHFAVTATWPAGLPAGLAIVLQAWVKDAAGVAGFAASNAMRGVTPPPPPAGNFPADWIHGGNCAGDPPIQVQPYGPNTWILRQSKCVNFEGPFVFLLFGQDEALLLDTGAAGNPPMQATVAGLVSAWATAHGKPSLPLLVAHTHSHGDHIANDGQFTGKPLTTVVGTSTAAVQAFWGFQDWPNDIRQRDLGGRLLDILAIPGHQAAHIAVYDHETALLLTGDTLYPGFLFISGAVSQGNFARYQASIQRLVDFIADKPVAWVFGCHVEMKNTPGQSYPYGTNNQPLEHDPQLLRSHLLELNAAVQAMGSSPHVEVHDDFIVQPSS